MIRLLRAIAIVGMLIPVLDARADVEPTGSAPTRNTTLKRRSGVVPVENKARYLAYTGAIDTHVQFPQFLPKDHTLMAWWMPLAVHAHEQPILAENGTGTFLVGGGSFRAGNGAANSSDPVLTVRYGNRSANYLLPSLKRGRWFHLAVVRRTDRVSLYLNGRRLSPRKVTEQKDGSFKVEPQAEINLAGATSLPTGNLRIGRNTPAPNISHWSRQAYGLVDDVAVFDRALTTSEIVKVYLDHRLKGSEPGLLAGFSFEAPISESKPLPAKLRGKWVDSGRVVDVLVTPTREPSDSQFLDNAFVLSTSRAGWVQLPFAKNEVWQVVQGNDNPSLSHNDIAAFSFDFVLAKKDSSSHVYPRGSRHAPIYAAADGRLFAYTSSPGKLEDTIYIKVSPEQEHVTYMHVNEGNLPPHPTGNKDEDKPGKWLYLIGWENGPLIARGQKLTTLGLENAHLHIAAGGMWGLGPSTIPLAFDDYWASDDDGKTWKHIIRGYPRVGQSVKRM